MPRSTRHALTRIAVTALLAAGVTATAPVAAAEAATRHLPQVTSADPYTHLDQYEARVIDLVNKQRRKHHLDPVRRVDTCADRYAETWSATLAATGRWEHQPMDRILTGCDMLWAGENLGRGPGLAPRRLVTLWLGSPTHRAVMLSTHATRIGVGTHLAGDGTLVTSLVLTQHP